MNLTQSIPSSPYILEPRQSAQKTLARLSTENAALRAQVATLTRERDAARRERDVSRAAHQADLAALRAVSRHTASTPDSLREAFRAETDPVKKATLWSQIKNA